MEGFFPEIRRGARASALSPVHARTLGCSLIAIAVWTLLWLPSTALGDTVADGHIERPSVEQIVAEMNERIGHLMRTEAGGETPRRFNQAKTIACLHGRFRARDDLPTSLAHGVFSPGSEFPAYLRFASAREPDDSKKDIRGLSIRLAEVPGEVLDGEPGFQDFLLNSYPGLFVATPEEFLAFIRAQQADRLGWFFLDPRDPHLAALWTAFRARRSHVDPFVIPYYSTVPFRLGTGTDAEVVKYMVRACDSLEPLESGSGPDRLRTALANRLETEPACLAFGVQRRTDPDRMPIEDARRIWSESDSPMIEVGRIEIEPQAVGAPDALARCESSRFDAWQSLAEHEPLGRMNAVRRGIYRAAAAHREISSR